MEKSVNFVTVTCDLIGVLQDSREGSSNSTGLINDSIAIPSPNVVFE